MSIHESQLRAWLGEFGQSRQLDTSEWKTRTLANGCSVYGIATHDEAADLARFLHARCGCELHSKRGPDASGWMVLCSTPTAVSP